MEIDKRNGNVAFNDLNHKYWDITDESKKYISVTTLIERYGQPFDESFWSKYKALQKIDPDAFRMEKKNLLLKKKWNKEILKTYGISENEFEKVRKDILNEWKQKNEEACKRGTKIHADIENSFYINPNNKELEKFVKGGKFVCKKNYTDLDLEYGVYPEYLVYRESDDKVLRIAGQIDLIVKSGNNIWIIDHKSNSKIDLKSGFDSNTRSSVKMKYPLNTLDDCNYNHYALQLSTYAWMLQKINPNFIIKDLIINHYDHDGNNTLYHCDYLKDEVEKMLYTYKKQVILDNNRAKRKRIIY